jgi:hypothetical protein
MRALALPVLFLVCAALFAGRSMAQDTQGAASGTRAPVAGAANPVIAGGYRPAWPGAYAGVCYSIWCAGAGPWQWRTTLERQRRLDELRRDATPAAVGPAPALWNDPQGIYLPPPTPEKQIQPAYRDRSVLRPEFRDKADSSQ